MKKATILFLTFISLVFISCKESETEDMCTNTEIGGFISVSGQTTGQINQTINLEVKFQVGNGCGQFNRFIETDFVNNEKTIEVESIYKGCVCTEDAPVRTVNYEFTPTESGVYKLNFKKNIGGFITHQITIN